MRLIPAVALSGLVVPMTVAISAGSAQAAPNPSCGDGYTTVESTAFAHGELVLQRDGDSWCAYVRRTGDYYGQPGYTRVVLSAPGGRPDVVNDDRLSYNVGPVYLDEPCVYAVGVVGDAQQYQASGVIPTRCG